MRIDKTEIDKAWARKSFWKYCNLKAPDFYTSDRDFLIDLCETLQSFYFSDDEVLIINMPPRHGKSRTASLFVEWILGRNQNEKIITGSYNEMLSTTFAKAVRNSIQETKADENFIVYSDIFPNVRIKRGDAAMNMWSLENGYNNYLATSPSGTATGFGASLLIIDDIVKSAYEANTDAILDKHWDWFTNTMLSRLEEGGKIIMVMTRWHSRDLAGRALAHYTADGAKVRHINYKALRGDGTMLCPAILSRESYAEKSRLMGADIASANYQQEPIDIKGKLYTHFKTYEKPPEFSRICAYIDTADTGDDYLCAIVYGVSEKEAYILDVIYTKDAMEITEPQTAETLLKNGVNIAYIESNNGGRGFARSVERILRDKHHTNKVIIRPFHQSRNKVSRIISNSTWVMEHIYFPRRWREIYPDFYDALVKYQRTDKNKHDDAPDALTGVAEKSGAGAVFSFD